MDFDNLPNHILEQIFVNMADKDLGAYVTYANKRLARIALIILAERYKNKMVGFNDFFVGVKSNHNLLIWNSKRIEKPPVQKYKNVYFFEDLVFLTEDGQVIVTGHRNDDGEKNVPPLSPVKTISYNENRILAVTEKGEVKGWGCRYGNLLNIPDQVQKKVIDAKVESYWAAVLLQGGFIVGWGERWKDPPPKIQGKIKQFSGEFSDFLALLHDGILVGYGFWFRASLKEDWLDRRSPLIPSFIQGKVILITSVNRDGYSVLLDDGTLYVRSFAALTLTQQEETIPSKYQGKFIGHIWQYGTHYGLLNTGEVVSWSVKIPKISLF